MIDSHIAFVIHTLKFMVNTDWIYYYLEFNEWRKKFKFRHIFFFFDDWSCWSEPTLDNVSLEIKWTNLINHAQPTLFKPSELLFNFFLDLNKQRPIMSDFFNIIGSYFLQQLYPRKLIWTRKLDVLNIPHQPWKIW